LGGQEKIFLRIVFSGIQPLAPKHLILEGTASIRARASPQKAELALMTAFPESFNTPLRT
jgi:hypothetical protein